MFIKWNSIAAILLLFVTFFVTATVNPVQKPLSLASDRANKLITKDKRQHFTYLTHRQQDSLTRRSKAVIPVNTKQLTQDHNCFSSQILSVEGSERVEVLSKVPQECLNNSIFWSDNGQTRQLYTAETMAALIAQVHNLAASYSGESDSGMLQLLTFIRAGYFVADSNENYTFSDSSQPLRNELIVALKLVVQSVNWHNNSLYQAQQVNYEWLYLIYNLHLQADLYSELMSLLDVIDTNYSTEKHWLANVWQVYDVLTRLDDAASTALEPIIAADSKHFSRLARWALDRDVLAFQDYVPHAPLYWLTNYLLGFTSLNDEAIALSKEALIAFPVDSEWFMTIIAGYRFSENCQQIASEYCPQAYRSSLMSRLFPNEYRFNDGRFVIYSALNFAQAQQLFNASQQVKAQFHRVTRNTATVTDDNTENLSIYVAHSLQDYSNFQQYLFDLPSDNGGIYIEQDATFYTYQRTSNESVYSLEELFRHEYVHYLEARFQIHGLYGQGEFYQSPYQHWEIEGFAEFLSGATASDGIKKRTSIMAGLAANSANKMSLSQVINSDSGFEVYPYGAMLHHFLYSQHPAKHFAMLDAVHRNDIASYNNLLSTWANDLELGVSFSVFLDNAFQDTSDWWSPETTWIFDSKMAISELSNIAQLFEQYSSLAFSCAEQYQSVVARFSCQAQVDGILAASSLSQQLDSLVRTLAKAEETNGLSFSCHHGALTTVNNGNADTDSFSSEVTCQGSLRTNTQVEEDLAPHITAEADFVIFDAGRATLAVDIYEPEQQPVSINWQQISGPSVTFTGTIDAEQVEFKAPLVEQDERATFEVSVSDGAHIVIDQVIVDIVKLDVHPIEFAELYDDITVTYGETVVLTVAAETVDEREITYTWSVEEPTWQDSYQFEMEPSIGASLPLDTRDIPLQAFLTFDRRTIQFKVIADDGLYQTEKYVRVYIQKPQTISIEHSLIEVEVNHGEQINLSVQASTSAQNHLIFRWQQTGLDQDENVDLQLEEYTGEIFTLDTNLIDASVLEETGRALVHFGVTINDNFSELEVTVRVYVNKVQDTSGDTSTGADTGTTSGNSNGTNSGANANSGGTNNQNQSADVENNSSSSGGSLSVIWLFSLMFIAFRRYKQK